MQVFSLVQSLVISGFIIGQQVGMKSMNQIFQYNLRLHGHTLIEGFLTHIAIDYSFLAKSAKVGITRVQRLQGIVREYSVVTVDDAPIVGTLRPTVHLSRNPVSHRPNADRLSGNSLHRHPGTVRQGNSFRLPHTSCRHAFHR